MYRGWDGTIGTPSTDGTRSTADTSTNGGTTAFSSQIAKATLTVTYVNDAPLLISVTPLVAEISASETTNDGTQVGTFLGASITDVDLGSTRGIAITATDNANGTWEYLLDHTSTWISIGEVSDSNALLLQSWDSVRFVPNGEDGANPTITYRAWDQTYVSGNNRADTITNGGTTAFSTSKDTANVVVNEVPLNISINDIFVDENASTAKFTVTLDRTSNFDVTLQYDTADGTATVSDSDYTGVSGGIVTIPAGDTTADLNITINDDVNYEENETFKVDLSNVNRGTISDSQGICTINNDDFKPTVTLSVAPENIAENGGVSTAIATLSAKSYQAVRVDLNFTGTASVEDYTVSDTSITIEPDSETGTIAITSVDDDVYEDDEMIVVDIVNVTNATEMGVQQQTVTITDDEKNVTISPDQGLSEENLDGRTITATLAGETFVTELNKNKFILNNAPSGTLVDSVARTDDTHVQILISYDGTDFDIDINNFTITISSDQLTEGEALTSDNLVITAMIEKTPTVTTSSFVTGITSRNAVVVGNITSDGGEVVTEKGIVYNTTGTPIISDIKVISSSITDSFAVSLNSLTPSTTYYVRAYAVNSEGISYGEEVTFTTELISANANLSNLSLASDVLSPAFQSNTMNYSSKVSYSVNSITVTPEAEDSNATITVNGSTVVSGQQSGDLALNVGNNTITILVTAEDGTTKAYTIMITRLMPPDLSAPYITATNPLNGAMNVPVTKTIEITFSENILAGTQIELMTLKHGDTVADYVYGIHENKLIINPTFNLDYGTLFTLTIPEQTVTDAVYNSMGDRHILTFTTENILEGNAALSGLTVSKGTLSPDFDADITNYTVMVRNNTKSIQITPTAAGENSTITVNGEIVGSGQPSQSISLRVGNNTIDILVTAEDGTEKTYQIIVKREQPDDDKDDNDNNNDTPRDNSQSETNNSEETGLVDVYVNGEEQKGATSHVKEENGQSVITIIIEDNIIQEELQDQRNNSIIAITVSGDFDRVEGTLNGETAKLMKDKNAVLEIKAGDITYRLPVNEINIEGLAQQLGQNPELEDVQLRVEINNADEDSLQIIQDTADHNNYQVLVKPIEFTITCTYGDKEVEISRFTSYVERIIAMPKEVDINKITTGFILNKDGTFTHIPTTILVIDGKTYVKINSLTNSTYSVIYNPITVAAVEDHWSKVNVNDMASRLVIKNPQTFTPDGEITRGEFAEYITKALGLYRTGVAKSGKFKDVHPGNEMADAIIIAVDNGIINGYPDNTFRPQAKITREEAMTMYAKAMDIAGLTGKDINRITNYVDKDTIAEWAYEFVKKTVSAGVFNGRTHETIDPKGTLTYAEAATAIRNLLIEAGLINQ